MELHVFCTVSDHELYRCTNGHVSNLVRELPERTYILHCLESLDHGDQLLRHDWDVDDLGGRRDFLNEQLWEDDLSHPQPARENL